MITNGGRVSEHNPVAAVAPQVSLALCSSQSKNFDEVLELRSRVIRRHGQAAADPVDSYSEHYTARLGQRLVGALRVTRAACGPLDCEQHYPRNLTCNWRGLLTSAGAFVLDSQAPRELRIARRLIEFAWMDQLPRGSRLDVINVHERAITYYGILGYELLAGSFFIHPRLGTPSHVMLSPSSPGTASPLADLFELLPDPFHLSELDLELEPWRERINNPPKLERLADEY
ncbi:hypothetical protein IT575_05870 [bacterium]|nr:hypothetical protein [bacterium]